MDKKKIGVIVVSNPDLGDFGPLCQELKKRGFTIILFARQDATIKPHYSPYLHKEHLLSVPHDAVAWYSKLADLDVALRREDIAAVFAKEAAPFAQNPEYFQGRQYKIFSLVHSVDNFHPSAIKGGVLDKTIVGYEKYGEYLGWDKRDYVALGLPKYDAIQNIQREDVIRKYGLPQNYILFLTPNNNLLSPLVVYRIVRKIRQAGYEVVLKGKKPKCHRLVYNFLAKKYFLSDLSFFPFITHELIVASQGVVGFDTTAVEEILMCERPLVNFSIKPYRDKAAKDGNFKQFVPMWNAPYVLDLNIMDHKSIGIFKPLPSFTEHFKKTDIDYRAIQQAVFNIPGGASARVADWLERELEIQIQ